MNYLLLMYPLVGALIGYVTNYIAVKMLFRPLRPVKIGRGKLPFTPGVIPKNKERLSHSVGETISNYLLTEEELNRVLLSEEKKKIIHKKAEETIVNFVANNTIKESLTKVISEEKYEKIENNMEQKITQSIVKSMIANDVGQVIATQIEKVVLEKMQGSMLGMLGLNSIISGISGEVAIKINEYLSQNGDELVSAMLSQKIAEVKEIKINTILQELEINEIIIADGIVEIYEKFITTKFSEILRSIGISEIVSEKINSMDNLELESLILRIMKKELNALINLGAFIGFILGLLNLLF